VFIQDWAIVAEADREQWDYTPFVHVGPLRYGMTHDEAVAAMRGFVSEQSRMRASGAEVAKFRTETASPGKHAVIAYFSAVDSLYCVVIDALRGPQVTLDGLRLVGRPPSELNAEIEAYTEQHGIGLVFYPTGECGAEEFGYVPGVQRAGDALLTSPAFGIVRSEDDLLYDRVPHVDPAWR
jgi:hypothetical protein